MAKAGIGCYGLGNTLIIILMMNCCPELKQQLSRSSNFHDTPSESFFDREIFSISSILEPQLLNPVEFVQIFSMQFWIDATNSWNLSQNFFMCIFVNICFWCINFSRWTSSMCISENQWVSVLFFKQSVSCAMHYCAEIIVWHS